MKISLVRAKSNGRPKLVVDPPDVDMREAARFLAELQTRFPDQFRVPRAESKPEALKVTIGFDDGTIHDDPGRTLLMREFESWVGLWAGCHRN